MRKVVLGYAEEGFHLLLRGLKENLKAHHEEVQEVC